MNLNKIIFSLASVTAVAASAMALVDYKRRVDCRQIADPPVSKLLFTLATAASGVLLANVANQLDETKHPERAEKLQFTPQGGKSGAAVFRSVRGLVKGAAAFAPGHMRLHGGPAVLSGNTVPYQRNQITANAAGNVIHGEIPPFPESLSAVVSPGRR